MDNDTVGIFGHPDFFQRSDVEINLEIAKLAVQMTVNQGSFPGLNSGLNAFDAYFNAIKKCVYGELE